MHMKCLMIFLLIFFAFTINGQSSNLIRNGSFESNLGLGTVPHEWFNCGPPTETPPDILTAKKNLYKVKHLPFAGNTYLCLVVRNNLTYESISQILENRLIQGKRYICTFYVSTSKSMKSNSGIIRDRIVKYNQPAIIRIWGGQSECSSEIELFSTEEIESESWKKVQFSIKPENDVRSISIEAYYSELKYYCGNVLIDDFSIIEID